MVKELRKPQLGEVPVPLVLLLRDESWELTERLNNSMNRGLSSSNFIRASSKGLVRLQLVVEIRSIHTAVAITRLC
jgi:hypothetical protein